MINASSRFKKNAKAPVKTVQVRMTQVVSEGATPLVYTSADLIQKMKIEASSTWLYSGAKKATVTLIEITENLFGYAWVLELGIVDPPSGVIDYITLGTFYTTKCDFKYDKGTTELTLFDYMNKAEMSWQQGEHTGYPKTVATLADDIATNLGYEGVVSMTGLPNATQSVQSDLWALISQEKYREVINEIANITGTTALVNSQNYLEFKPFRNAEEILTYDNLRTYKLGLHYGKINSVVLSRQPQNDDVALQDSTSIDANGLTEAKIINNQIADNNRQAFIQPLFNALNGIEFDGIEMNTEGHGWYEIGDSLQVGEGEKDVLPEGYQRVEYIEKNRTAYILTDVIPTIDTRVVARFSLEGSTTSANRAFYWTQGSQDLTAWLGTARNNWRFGGQTPGAFVLNGTGVYDIDHNKSRLIVNGQQRTYSAVGTMSGSIPIHIFDAATYDCVARVHSMKIYNAVGVVRDFVPCVRSDGVAGLYDKITATFYGSSNSDNFIAGNAIEDPVVDFLPYQYQQIEYIESVQSNQRIHTYINWSQELTNVDITIDAQCLGTTNDSIVLIQRGSTPTATNWNGAYKDKWGNLASNLFDISCLERVTMKSVFTATSTITTINGVTKTRSGGTANEGEFIIGTGGSHSTTYRLYGAKVSVDGVLARDFVPCYRCSDGVVGMYERITGTFYANAGTGSFKAGSNITHNVVVTDLTMTLEGGGFKETIKCITPDLTSTDYTATGGIKKSIYNTEIKTDKQEQEITSIVSRQDTFESQVTEEFTQVRQDIAGLTVSVQTTGGGNYIKNSVGYSKDSDGNLVNWTKAGNGTFSSETSPESMQAGAISGSQISLFNATLTQRVILAPNIEYTLSYIGKKSVTGTAGVIISNANGSFNLLMPNQTAVYWEKKELTFTPTLGYVDIIITADSNITEFAITDIMLSQGDLSTPWRQADGEILNTQVAVDTEGIRVNSSVYEGDETVMTPLEFAGYSSVSGTKTKVFSLNRDTTEVQKISIQQQMSMPPLKVIPLDNPSGWAFVKEGN